MSRLFCFLGVYLLVGTVYRFFFLGVRGVDVCFLSQFENFLLVCFQMDCHLFIYAYAWECNLCFCFMFSPFIAQYCRLSLGGGFGPFITIYYTWRTGKLDVMNKWTKGRVTMIFNVDRGALETKCSILVDKPNFMSSKEQWIVTMQGVIQVGRGKFFWGSNNLYYEQAKWCE